MIAMTTQEFDQRESVTKPQPTGGRGSHDALIRNGRGEKTGGSTAAPGRERERKWQRFNGRWEKQPI